MSDLSVGVTSSTIASASLQGSSVLVSMNLDGSNVRVDWVEVEKQSKGRDPYLMPLAKVLIAVRDRTYLTHQ